MWIANAGRAVVVGWHAEGAAARTLAREGPALRTVCDAGLLAGWTLEAVVVKNRKDGVG